MPARGRGIPESNTPEGPVDRVELVVEEWTEGPGPRFPRLATFIQGTDRFRYRFVEIEPLETAADSLFRLP